MAPECLEVLEITASSLSGNQPMEQNMNDAFPGNAPRSIDQLIGIPQVQRPAFQSTSYYSPCVVLGWGPR